MPKKCKRCDAHIDALHMALYNYATDAWTLWQIVAGLEQRVQELEFELEENEDVESASWLQSRGGEDRPQPQDPKSRRGTGRIYSPRVG